MNKEHRPDGWDGILDSDQEVTGNASTALGHLSDGELRRILEDARAESGRSMKALTVLSPQIDPYRLDTPANHRNGEWLAERADELGVLSRDRKIHLRGLHYQLSQRDKPWVKPNGEPYLNDDANWEWMSEKASKAARWLGYIPFTKIKDERNAEPVVHSYSKVEPWAYLSVGIEIDLPDVSEIDPKVGLTGFRGTQPYHIVLIGEKSSLEDELDSVARTYGADLYLPTGDISDTFVHQIAMSGAEDGRPMVVFYFADFDPSGWNMAVVTARKLQAFKACLYPELNFRVYRTAVTVDQVRAEGLPSTPLKSTERRADRWKQRWGVEQTEIDAFLALRPGLLATVARNAVSPFYDTTLNRRVAEARQQWIADAQEVVDENIDQDRQAQLREDFDTSLRELQDEIEALNDALRVDLSEFEVPEIPEIPEPEISEDQPLPLLDSDWSYVKGTEALIESKEYRR